MYCNNCGSLIDDDSVFCSNCGAPQGGIKSNGSFDLNDNNGVVVTSVCQDQPESVSDGIGSRSRIINTLFAVISSVLLFAIFLIPLEITTGSMWSNQTGGKPMILNGYDIILKQDIISVWWGKNGPLASSCFLAILAISLVLLLLSVLTLIIKKGNTTATMLTIILNTMFSVMYCAVGVITVSLVHPSYSPKTYAYLGLAVFVVFLVIYIVTKSVLAKKQKRRGADI